MSKYNVGLKTLQKESLPQVYGDLVYKSDFLAKLIFLDKLKTIATRCRKLDDNMDSLRQTACIVINPIIFDNFASLINCTTRSRSSDLMTASPSICFRELAPDCKFRAHRGSVCGSLVF